MSKHTPGPWSFEDQESATFVRNSDGLRIADTHSYSPRLVREHENAPDAAVRLANARLIAAAPDLLEALNALHEAFLGVVINVPKARKEQFRLAVEKASAALAKAEGTK